MPLPRSLTVTARLAGWCYLLTIVTGMVGALVVGPRLSTLATLLSLGFYVGVTLFTYRLFAAARPVLSLLAAGVSLVGCGLGVLQELEVPAGPVKSLVLFGIYCLLTSYLIWRSGLLPRWVGALLALALAGLGWLSFLSPQLARRVAPFPMVSGLVGEGALTLWLLVGKVPAGAARPTPARATADTKTEQLTR